MKSVVTDYFADMDDQGSTVAMDVDDVDPLEIFGEGFVNVENKLADSDFFNKGRFDNDTYCTFAVDWGFAILCFELCFSLLLECGEWRSALISYCLEECFVAGHDNHSENDVQKH
ncbi:hypothetical protein RJ641_008992 [Dillenia turbinata]|uniref:Uncharacterized protein n=1 Tax=Dillenia turbinata TaxID=194707 RepID=A0AAN8V707_9MAGN